MALGTLSEIRPSEQSWVGKWSGTLLVFVGSLLLYMINIERFPHPDELYHILAARGMLATGEPQIAEGVYERVLLHTWLIARFFEVFGDSLFSARLPSAIAIAASAALLFAWLSRHAGATVAWIGAVLFAISPFAVDIAQFARFYGLQTFTFLGGALLTYAAVEHSGIARWRAAAGAVILLALATYFQETSLIGIAGLAIWLALRIGTAVLTAEQVSQRQKLLFVGAVVLLGVIALAVFVASGLALQAWDKYRSVPPFNQSRANEFWFYHAWFTLFYPSIWPLIGIISLSSLVLRPKLAFFALIVFVTSFILNSFAAPKGLRYFIYAQPFLFVLLGIALGALATQAGRWLGSLRTALVELMPLPSGIGRVAANALIAGALLVLFIGNPASIRTVALLADVTVPPEKPPVNWAAAREALEPAFEQADVVVAMAELEMLYYYDRYDILLSASRLSEIPGGVDFDPDFRTGRPVIGSLDAMTKVLGCYDSGIFVTNTRRWRNDDVISKPVADLIALHAQPVELPRSSRVLAFAWTNDDVPADPAFCASVPRFDQR